MPILEKNRRGIGLGKKLIPNSRIFLFDTEEEAPFRDDEEWSAPQYYFVNYHFDVDSQVLGSEFSMFAPKQVGKRPKLADLTSERRPTRKYVSARPCSRARVIPSIVPAKPRTEQEMPPEYSVASQKREIARVLVTYPGAFGVVLALSRMGSVTPDMRGPTVPQQQLLPTVLALQQCGLIETVADKLQLTEQGHSTADTLQALLHGEKEFDD